MLLRLLVLLRLRLLARSECEGKNYIDGFACWVVLRGSLAFPFILALPK